jgi:hypothetical protein
MLPIQTLQYFSLKHILISLTNSMSTPNSMKILYNTNFLEVFEYLMYSLIVLPFFLQYLMNAETLISS